MPYSEILIDKSNQSPISAIHQLTVEEYYDLMHHSHESSTSSDNDTEEKVAREEFDQLDTTVTMLTSSMNEVENRVNSRIDNIIAHNNDTNGNSELIDIRTGNDGTVYTTAGTAVRSQFNFINNDLIRKYLILTNGIFEISFNWKQGGFDTTDGKTLNTASSTRIYEDDYIIGDGVTEMIWTKNLGEDINLWVYKYDINGSYISYTQYDSTSVKFTLENGYQYRFNLYRSNGADISNLVKNISFSMSADIYQSNSLLKQHIDNISEQVDNLSEHIDNIPEHYIPNVHIMNEYNAVVGRELNFYWCQIFDCMNWKALEIIPRMTTNSNSVTVCQYDDRFSVIPTQSGDFTLTFTLTTLKNNNYVDLITRTITVHAYPDSIPSSNKKVLFIGDSRTDYSRINTYAKNQLGNHVTMLGTRGTEPYCHEGRYGWSAQTYCTQAGRSSTENNETVYNAFWNPTSSKFDFSYYMTNQNYDGVDYVNILLGVNNSYTDIEINYIEQMIQSIHEYDSNIIVSVMTEYQLPNSPYYSGAFIPIASRRYWNKVINKFGSREEENVYIIPSGQEIDDNYDWKHQTMYASQLNPIEINILSDNIHCTYGFDKMSNSWLIFFTAMENLINAS